MKLLIIAACLCLTSLVSCQTSYTEKYDTIDLDEVLANRRLLTAYLKCVLEEGKCTAEGRELKSHIAEALQNGCAKCTAKQRQGMRTVIKHLINNENEYWVRLCKMYDPDNVYTTKYEEELKTLQAV